MARLLCIVFSTGAFSKPLLRVRESQRKDLRPYRAVQAPETKTGALWHCQCPIQSTCLASRWAGSIASTGKSEYLSSGTKAGVPRAVRIKPPTYELLFLNPSGVKGFKPGLCLHASLCQDCPFHPKYLLHHRFHGLVLFTSTKLDALHLGPLLILVPAYPGLSSRRVCIP